MYAAQTVVDPIRMAVAAKTDQACFAHGYQAVKRQAELVGKMKALWSL